MMNASELRGCWDAFFRFCVGTIVGAVMGAILFGSVIPRTGPSYGEGIGYGFTAMFFMGIIGIGYGFIAVGLKNGDAFFRFCVGNVIGAIAACIIFHLIIPPGGPDYGEGIGYGFGRMFFAGVAGAGCGFVAVGSKDGKEQLTGSE